MSNHIIRMTRYGQQYRVILQCGHTMTRTVDEIKKQQLFIGKYQPYCEECAKIAPNDETCGEDINRG